MGHPLSQTLFTSLYLDRLLWPIPATLDGAQFTRRTQETRSEPEVSEGMQHGKGELTDPGLVSIVLRAYCLALVKACDRVIGRVSSEYYFEVSSQLQRPV